MKKINIILLSVVLLSGCNYLDKNPDMRATIDTKNKVELLLVSAYTRANAGAIQEFSSDNIMDNNADGTRNLAALDRMYDEIFGWQDVVSSNQQDSPKYIWDGCYKAIATANQALDAIAELEAQGIDMSAEKGEALLCRAYHHFLLVQVFCHAYKDEAQSKNDLGIYYMTAPETTVHPEYDRSNVYDTYKHIEEDLEEGLKLVADDYYSVPKYHFNVRAAHAFAARFYLYTRQYDKVIEHSNYVLGTTKESAQSMMFDNYNCHVVCTNAESQQYAYIDPSSPSNLLIYTTMSQAPYTNFPTYGRYQLVGDALNYSLLGRGPCWSNRALTGALSIWSYGQDHYGSFLAKSLYFFEYTDKVNGYGFIHGVTRAFTANETLLCRAEAYIFKNQPENALQDLTIWANSYNVNYRVMDTIPGGDVKLTRPAIEAFYRASNEHYYDDLHNEDMSSSFVIPAGLEPMLRCVLHFRRIETIQDGLRWQDIKRYGITITHQQGTDDLKTLVWNDDRRALQLPQEVILAGQTANPRNILGDNSYIHVYSSPAALPENEDSQLSTPHFETTSPVMLQ